VVHWGAHPEKINEAVRELVSRWRVK
jgi:hypothetical protein